MLKVQCENVRDRRLKITVTQWFNDVQCSHNGCHYSNPRCTTQPFQKLLQKCISPHRNYGIKFPGAPNDAADLEYRYSFYIKYLIIILWTLTSKGSKSIREPLILPKVTKIHLRGNQVLLQRKAVLYEKINGHEA